MRAEERKTTTWRGPRARGTRPTGAIEGRVATRVSRAEAGGASTHRELLLRLGHEVLGFGGVVRHRDDRVGVRATQCGRGNGDQLLDRRESRAGVRRESCFSFFSFIKATAATCVFERKGSLSSSFVSASYQRFSDDKKRAETVTPHVFFIQSASSSSSSARVLS